MDKLTHAWMMIAVMEKVAPVTTAVQRWSTADRGLFYATASYKMPFGLQATDEPMITHSEPGLEALAERFEHLAERWNDETWAYSFPERKVLHEAYQKIMTMGWDAVPLILRRLRERGPDHWFWALEMITDENPAVGAETMSDATATWLAWGRDRDFD